MLSVQLTPESKSSDQTLILRKEFRGPCLKRHQMARVTTLLVRVSQAFGEFFDKKCDSCLVVLLRCHVTGC